MSATGDGPLLEARGLFKSYRRRGPRGARRTPLQAVAGVDLELTEGRTLAVVGRSGSGKSTLARCLALLERPDRGELRFQGRDLLRLEPRLLAPIRRRIQLIFQDPAEALNPRFTAARIVEEPLVIAGDLAAPERRRRVLAAIDQVGLPRSSLESRPHRLSGGQRQRLAIARALTLSPRLLILDEALSGLDLSIRAQIVNLLGELQGSHGLTYLYILHDLSMVAYLADRVAVMLEGRIVESGTTVEILGAPRHPHTRALLASSRLGGRAVATG